MAKKTVAKAKKATASKAKKVTKTAKAAPKAKPRVAKVARPKRKPSPDSKFMKPLKVSAELASVVGKGPLPRTEVTKLLWAYIKKNKCQDAQNKRNINPDENLAKVFGSKKSINMFEMTRLVNKHLS